MAENWAPAVFVSDPKHATPVVSVSAGAGARLLTDFAAVYNAAWSALSAAADGTMVGEHKEVTKAFCPCQDLQHNFCSKICLAGPPSGAAEVGCHAQRHEGRCYC